MTSPVDTSVKLFRSTMPGAPALRGQVGSLISLLDACLVNGWGSQTASSVIITGGVATATFPADHAAAVESVVLVAGATPAGLNGEQKVTAVAPNVIRWATAEADGTATGTITVKMAAAGWTKVYTGTNLAVYKSADPQAHGQFLRVNDTGTTAARVVGYENMTAVSTGTGLFPTSAQLSGGFYWGKSHTAGSADVAWAIAADSRAFYFNAAAYVTTGGPTANGGAAYFFGDLVPHSRSGDAYATMLTGAPGSVWESYGGQYILSSDVATRAIPRKVDGTGTAIQPEVSPYTAYNLSFLPNTVNGRVPFTPIMVRDSQSQTGIRADIPGGRLSLHFGAETVLSEHQIFYDTDGRARVNMLAPNNMTSASDFNSLAVDVTGPWR